MSNTSEVIFKGEKFFERYEKNVDILLVNHEEYSCIEVIVHGISAENKTTRLYLNSVALIYILSDEDYTAQGKSNIPFSDILGCSDIKTVNMSMLGSFLVEGLRILPSIFISEFDLCFELNGQCYVMNDDNFFEFAVKPRGLVPFNMSSSLTTSVTR